LAQSLRGAGVGGQAPLWDRLSSLNIPTLIVVGALDAKYREIGHRMQSAMPQSRLVTINNSGHTCHAEQPQWFIDVVESFLNEDDQPLT
jgi:pimeloyl-ACP methyl ester carboxylesterase